MEHSRIRKPIIGVTSNLDSITALSNNNDEFIFIRANYVQVILEHGGIPLIINSRISGDDAASIVERLDGMLFIGGQDIDPSFYGEERMINYCPKIIGSGSPYERPARDKPNPERDTFEIALYTAAKKSKVPILGICRGYQLINVAEGGSLYQEIPMEGVLHTILPNETIPNHDLIITDGSHAHKIFGSTAIMTCSIHHQGIKNLGSDLIASGFATDGLIEIVEGKDPEHFLIGVQGHPERVYKDFTEHNYLFEAFIGACNKYSSHG